MQVSGLVPAGVDPHSFEPSPRDLSALTRADLIVGAGPDAEDRFLRMARHAAPGAPIENLWPRPPDADPHWWNSLVETEKIVDRLGAVLAARRPRSGPQFSARRSALVLELRALQSWSREQLAVIPSARRVLVTTHDAFGLFARDYGFRVEALAGFNPEAEPSARTLARLESTIRQNGVPSVFLDAGANPRLIEALAADTGARIGGELYADGPSIQGEGRTFAGMQRHNVQTLVDGLKEPTIVAP